jgi:hypothetical protein
MAQPAAAQDGLPDTGTLQYTGNYGFRYGSSPRVYVGPYVGAIPGHPTIDIYCVDFNHGAPTSAATYNFNNFAAIESGDTEGILDAETRWGYDGGDNWENYKKAAYLTTFFNGIQNSSLTFEEKSTKIGELHAAIWHLFNPGNPSSTGWPTVADDQAKDDWIGEANAGYEAYFSSNARYWYIATDVNIDTDPRGIWNEASGGKQEYLVHVTPEPTSIILLGTGLLGMGIVVRRKRADLQEDAG